MAGKLLLVATPIGNLGDISERALEAISSCELLLCEDTRVSGRLLKAKGLEVPVRSFHDHNESSEIERTIEKMEQGSVVGLISDAGTPLLSDPGYPLVREAIDRGITVESLPGAFAGVTALTASGLPPVPFVFFGFFGRKRRERVDQLRKLRDLAMTAVFYESPNRVLDTLRDIEETIPDASVVVARELTKLHEEYLRGSAGEIAAELDARDRVRGEIVLVIGPVETEVAPVDHDQVLEAFVELRDKGMRRPDAARILADRFGMPRGEVYDLISGK